MKGFWNDQNGFNLADLEKLTLVITFILSVLANLYNFVVNKYTDILMVQMMMTQMKKAYLQILVLRLQLVRQRLLKYILNEVK